MNQSPAPGNLTYLALAQEIDQAQEVFDAFGITPLAFRPPLGITNPRLWRLLLQRGMHCVTFSCRAGDFGNRRIKGLSQRPLRRVKPGAIVLLHDVMPRRGMEVDLWLAEIERFLGGLKQRQYQVQSLSELLGCSLRSPRGEARGEDEQGTINRSLLESRGRRSSFPSSLCTPIRARAAARPSQMRRCPSWPVRWWIALRLF